MEFLRTLQADVEAAARAAHIVGMSMVVSVDGRVHEVHAGAANLGTGVPMTPPTIHQIGSISKVFTATLILQLIEQADLKLTDAVADILPELRLNGATVPPTLSVYHLLTHTSGLELGDWQGDALDRTGRGDDCLEKYIRYCADHVLLKAPAARFPAPQADYHYSNIGYVLLGCIAERLTGRTWDDLLAERIFAPLGLAQSTSLPEQAVRFPNAIGHLVKPGGGAEPVMQPYLARAMGPAAGRIKMTGRDLVTFADAFLNSSGRTILSPASMTLMRKPAVALDEGRGQGLGWMLYDWAGVPVFGHDGGVPGQTATLRILPDQRIVVAAFFNGGNAVGFAGDFFPRFFKAVANVSYPEVPAAHVAHFATYMMQGNYDFPGKDVDIVDGKRVARAVKR